jgi:hypothetical protein
MGCRSRAVNLVGENGCLISDSPGFKPRTAQTGALKTEELVDVGSWSCRPIG